MAKASTSSDIFNAIAEPARREILDTLAREGELAVSDLVVSMGISQPSVSKHLSVLRDVGVVAVERRGRQRMYSIHAEQLRAVHQWTQSFERFWTNHAERVKQRAERMSATRQQSTSHE